VALTPEKQLEAWNKAVSTAPSGKVTATHVAQIAKGYHQTDASTHVSSNKTKKQPIPLTDNSTQPVERSCWNCSHCSSELLDDPHSFYCYQLGKLNFIELDGLERAKDCAWWTYLGSETTEIKKRAVGLRETFSLQLPTDLLPLIQDAARESGLVVVDWVEKILYEAASKTNTL
jgi:hypothetical protein